MAPARFAASPDEARERFAEWRSADPYPEVAAALLNSADIADYVAATGMVYPFDEAKLKPASYPLPLGGKILWWDNKNRRRRQITIGEGDNFVLQPNSIAFVTLEPILQVPDYIALRFNLKIRNVYRGLLLGTGPLIDPGFVGRLSFPLHNLTTNEYRFRGGEDMIWVELTKLSTDERWLRGDGSAPARAGTYRPYRFAPGGRNVEDYVEDAVGHGHVWSSISEALREAAAASSRARLYSVAGVLALIALVASVVGVAGTLLWNQWQLPRTSDIRRNEKAITDLRAEVRDLRARLHALQTPKSSKNP